MNKINFFLILLFAVADALFKKLLTLELIHTNTLTQNPGLPFIGKTVSGFFDGFVVVLVFVIFVYLYSVWNDLSRTDWAFSLILGGAIANLTDRLTDGSVVDFIYFAGGVFNLADIFIWLGIIILLVRFISSRELKAKHD